MPGPEASGPLAAEDLSFTPGGPTRLIARMEEAGLLARHPHPSDGRAVPLRPTSHGRAPLKRALQMYVPQLTGDLLDPLTPVERLIQRELVGKLLAHSARGPVRQASQPQPLVPPPGEQEETEHSEGSHH